MAEQNPYDSPGHGVVAERLRPRSGVAALVGLVIGGLPPFALGAWGWYSFACYVATQPPGTPVCGNPVLGALFLVFIVAPITGVIGALVGWVIATWRR